MIKQKSSDDVYHRLTNDAADKIGGLLNTMQVFLPSVGSIDNPVAKKEMEVITNAWIECKDALLALNWHVHKSLVNGEPVSPEYLCDGFPVIALNPQDPICLQKDKIPDESMEAFLCRINPSKKSRYNYD